jgi:hypothetical protein
MGRWVMPKLLTKLMAFVTPCGFLAITVVISAVASVAPARAQDIFGFLRPFAAPVPTYLPYEYQPVPTFERPVRKVRPRPKAVPVEQAAIKMPQTPKAPGETANPVPGLLADSTLRAGDMVMFPDGLRVFTGRAGDRHTMADFVPVARSGRAVPASTRKEVGHLRPGANVAWSADGARSGGKLAVKVEEVGTTGSLRPPAR